MANDEVRVLWVSGNRDHRQKLIAKLKAEIGDHEEVRVSDDATYDVLERAVLADDCFGTKRLVVVDAIPQPVGRRETMVNDFKKLLTRVPDECVLLFNGIEPESQKAIFNAVSKVGKVKRFDDALNESQAVAEVTERLAEEGKTISPEDAVAFVRVLPSEDGKDFDLDTLGLASTKLVLFTEKRKVVTADDVAAVGSTEAFVDVWQVFSAIDASDFDKAHSLFYRLLPSIVASEYGMAGAVTKFMSTSMWRFRSMMLAKELLGRGLQPNAVISEMQKITRPEQEGTGFNMRMKATAVPLYSPGWLNSLMGGYSPLTKYTFARLGAIVKCLQDSNEQVRYLKGDEQFLLLADAFLMLACGQMTDTRRRKLSEYFEGCNEL